MPVQSKFAALALIIWPIRPQHPGDVLSVTLHPPLPELLAD
jgi:hypothetical protein